MKRTLPQLRERQHEITAELAQIAARVGEPRIAELAAELDEIAEEGRRRPPVKIAPRRAAAVTEEIALAVIEYAATHPTTPNRLIGQRFGIDGGRVSEILAGKRGE